MPDNRFSEHSVVRGALVGETPCPSVEQLESMANLSAEDPTPLAVHVRECPRCRTELTLLRSFIDAGADDSAEIRKVVATLRANASSSAAFRSGASGPWWRRFLATSWLTPAALGLTTALLLVGGLLSWKERSLQPNFHNSIPTKPEVLRSGSFSLRSPSGDLQERPTFLRWESVPSATKYEVRMLEVDRTQLWVAETSATQIDLPLAVREKLVPAKTVFCEVVARDSAGRQVGDTGLIRMRVQPR